jgi:hypothetical protein
MPNDLRFRPIVDGICDLLLYYAASSGNPLRTFRNNLSVLSSRIKKSMDLNTGPIGCPETSVRDYHLTLSNIMDLKWDR